MMLFGGSTSEFAGGDSFKEIYDNLANASAKAIQTLSETFTSIQDQSIKLQRSLTNIKLDRSETLKFQKDLEKVFEQTLDIGGTFKDVTETLTNFSAGLESSMMPSETTMKNMVEMAKATGMANAELGKAVGELTKFTFSQTRALELMNNITKTSRMAGADAKAVIKEVTDNLTKTDTLGFRNGVEGLTKMALQAKVLKTSITDIGSLQLSQTLWDPTKAIELAQNMQMYGGQVGAMGNAFEVFRMGAYDAEKLQDEMIKVTAQAFHMNEQTGKIETSFLSRQQLKAQAEAMGMTYEKAAQIGKEKFKQLEIEKKLTENAEIQKSLKSGGISPEIMQLMTSMSELKKDAATGKMVMSLNIPGMAEIGDLEGALKDPGKTTLLIQQMKEYQTKASMTDKEIAQANMSISENQAKDVKSIRDLMYINYQKTQPGDLESKIKAFQEASEVAGKVFADTRMAGASAKMGAMVTDVQAGATRTEGQNVANMEALKTAYETIKGTDTFVSKGENALLRSKGDFKKELIKLDNEDDILAFPDGGKIVDKLANFYNNTKSNFKNSINDVNDFFSKVDNEPLPKAETPKNLNINQSKSEFERFEKIMSQKSSEMIIKNEPIKVEPITIEVTINGDKKSEDVFKDQAFVNKMKEMILQKVSETNKKGFGDNKNVFSKS